MVTEPSISHQAQLRIVLVPTWGDPDVKQAIGSIGKEAIDLFQARADAIVTVHGKDGVVPGIFEEHGTWRDQGGDLRPWPLKSVDEKHAVAVAVHHAFTHVILE